MPTSCGRQLCLLRILGGTGKTSSSPLKILQQLHVQGGREGKDDGAGFFALKIKDSGLDSYGSHWEPR